MGHFWHLLLLTVALMLNWGDRRALALTLVIGFSLVIPVASFTWRSNFYLVCGLFELLVALCAIRIDTQASQFIALMCAMLFVYHMTGWAVGGHPPDSPYRLLVKIAEYAEILACSLFANPLLRLLKNDARNS